MRQVTVQLFSL